MDVIIDANIIRRDLKLNDRNFEILSDYLKKTNSKIIFPSIVIEEIKGLYKRALKERYDEFEKSTNKLKSTLVTIELPERPQIDIESEVNKYIDFIHSKLGTTNKNIVEYKNEFLPELVRRAIDRKKPLDGKGQQFRDGLLWLTLLDYAENSDEKRVALISDNPADFGDKNENTLCSELIQETKEREVEVKYFRRLSDFAKEHASTIEFITKEWIEKNTDIKIIEKLFEETLDNIDDNYILDNVSLEEIERTTGYIHRTEYLWSNLTDFYVYEKSDGTILLNASWEFETEFEVEIERYIERDSPRYERRVSIDPETGEPEMDMVFVPDYIIDQEFDHKYDAPIFLTKYVITIKDSKVENYEFKDWDWG
ncbi:MAG: PIN domain-containing protein [Candidatus Arcticimaribacter sp.]